MASKVCKQCYSIYNREKKILVIWKLFCFILVESRRRRDDDVMMPMMGEGMNPDVGPPHPGMMNKKHFPPGENRKVL